MKKCIFLFLTLALIVVCGMAVAEDTTAEADPAAPFLFPNGLGWDAALPDVAVTEGISEPADFLLSETEYMQEYWFPNPSNMGIPQGTYYIFRNDELACVGLDYYPSSDDNDTALLDELVAEYGEPTEADTAEQAVEMFDAYKESFPPEILTWSTGWTASDGTKIYYMNVADELYVFYVNEDRLFDEAEETTEDEQH